MRGGFNHHPTSRCQHAQLPSASGQSALPRSPAHLCAALRKPRLVGVGITDFQESVLLPSCTTSKDVGTQIWADPSVDNSLAEFGRLWPDLGKVLLDDGQLWPISEASLCPKAGPKLVKLVPNLSERNLSCPQIRRCWRRSAQVDRDRSAGTWKARLQCNMRQIDKSNSSRTPDVSPLSCASPRTLKSCIEASSLACMCGRATLKSLF